jgi:hypothetical protein
MHENLSNAIIVWRIEDAPSYLKGCVVDWVAFTPDNSWIIWLDDNRESILEILREDRPDVDEKAIVVWIFDFAPEEYRKRANGEDADWLAYIPRALADVEIPWMADGSKFGCAGVDQIELPNGDLLRVGCHA